MTTLDVLEVYILAHLDYKAKDIGFVGRANAEGYGVPHPGTAIHPNYRGSILDPTVYYRVKDSEFLVWSCECMVLTVKEGDGLLGMLKDQGFKIHKVSVRELKRRNALYRPAQGQDN